jgi:hypothetical protein
MSVLFCPSQDRHRSWTGRAGYRGCCFVLTRLRVVCFPCCHFSLFFTGPGTPHSFRRPPVTSVPIPPQSVRSPPKAPPPPNKREVFPICAARAGLFAPPVLSSFFLFCLRTFQFGEQQTKKKRRQATTQPPPRPDSPKGAGLFSTNTKTNRALLPPPPVPVAVFRIGRRKMPLSGMRPFYATERREKNHPEEAEASVFYTNCAILAAPRFLPATPSQPHLCVSPAKFPLHTPEGAPPPPRDISVWPFRFFPLPDFVPGEELRLSRRLAFICDRRSWLEHRKKEERLICFVSGSTAPPRNARGPRQTLTRPLPAFYC